MIYFFTTDDETGLYSAIFYAYEKKIFPDGVFCGNEQISFTDTTIKITPDEQKALRVKKCLYGSRTKRAASDIAVAIKNGESDKLTTIFNYAKLVIDNKNKDMEIINKRIEDLELHIKDLCTSDVYKAIDKKHISLVTSPIKKTNVIIKNVNFQYALRLWNYMQDHTDDDVKNEKNKKDYYDNDTLKKMADETFLINYLISKTLDEDESQDVIEKEELSKKVVNNMLENLLSFNNIPLEELQNLIKDQYEVVKYKEVVSDKYIENLFKSNISKYLESIDKIKI